MDDCNLEDLVLKNEYCSNNNKRNFSCKIDENIGIPVYNTIAPDTSNVNTHASTHTQRVEIKPNCNTCINSK